MVASQLANISRPLLEVQRVNVLVRRGKRFLLYSVSGIDSIARQSHSVRCLRQAVAACAPLDQCITFPPELDSSQTELPDSVVKALDHYVDIAFVSALVAMPLRDNGAVVGCIVAENFDQPLPGQLQQNLRLIGTDCGSAIANALEHEKTPLRWATWWLADLSRSVRWATAIACVMIATFCLLWFVNIPARVTATGQMLPQSQRHLFVPSDSNVQTIHVKDGQTVRQGEPLITLQSPVLDARQQELRGELDLRRQELSTVKTQRSGVATRRGTQDASTQGDQLAGREAILLLEIEHLQKQVQLVQDRLDELQTVSPVDGIVAMAVPISSLQGRPVTRGQLLLDCYDPTAQWFAQVDVAADDMATVLRQTDQQSELSAQVGLLATPDAVVAGKVTEIASQTHLDAVTGANMLRMKIHLPTPPPLNTKQKLTNENATATARTGLSVVAKIDVGQQRLGAWLFRDWARWLSDQIRFRAKVIEQDGAAT